MALLGVLLIATTIGGSFTVVGFALGLASAASWRVGNVLVKRAGPTEMLGLVVWLSLIPPLPAIALSLALDGPVAVARSLPGASWPGLGAALYLGLVATLLAYAIWNDLLRPYPTTTVVPFALLVPCVGALASTVVLGERFGVPRLAGMACVLLGLVLTVVPARAAARATQTRW